MDSLVPDDIRRKINNVADSYYACFNTDIDPKNKDEYFRVYEYAVSDTHLLIADDKVKKFYNFVREQHKKIDCERVHLLEVD